MATARSYSASTSPSRVAFSRILTAGLIAIVVSIVVNLIIRAIAFAVIDLPAGFAPLSVGAIAVLTAVGVAAATLVYALVNRFLPNPARTFTIIAVVALIVSIIPNFMLAGNPAMLPMPGDPATPAAAYTLILFHIAAAVVSVVVLTRAK
jgi:hypothetical protein